MFSYIGPPGSLQDQLLSLAVQWICVHETKISQMSHILDDFICFAKNTSQCQLNLDRYF